MRLEKVQYTAKAQGCRRLRPTLAILRRAFAATMTLAPSAALLAQQPAQTAGQNQDEFHSH
jgi:hypothetical protein